MYFERMKHMLAALAIAAALAPAAAYARSSRENRHGAGSDSYNAGMALESEKKYKEALAKFEEAIQADPSYISAYVEAARAYVMTGKRKDGLKRIEAALQVAKKRSDIERLKAQRRLLSEIFYTNGTFQRYQDGVNNMRGMKLRAAIEAFEQAMATEPDNVEVLLAYARALQLVDDWKESVNVLEQAFALNPDKREARVLLAIALLNTNPDRTLQLLKPLIEDPKESTEEVMVAYAQALAKRGDTKEAIAVLQKDVDKHTDRLRSLFWLGKFHSDAPESRWIARKHLQTFLKRSERGDDADDLKDLKQEARRIIERIHGELGIENTDAQPHAHE